MTRRSGWPCRESRSAVTARLDREEQGLALEEAEERYQRLAGSLTLGARAESLGDSTADLSIGPSLRVPTGGTFTLAYSKPLAGDHDRHGSTIFTFSQPLLKGFGRELDTWPLRDARLTERINLRAFRDRAASIVNSTVSAYRGMLRAQQRVAIAREALERAQQQLAINRALVDAGRLAPQDLVQTEAGVADKAYALEDARNALETANSTLVRHARPRRGAAHRAAGGASRRARAARP